MIAACDLTNPSWKFFITVTLILLILLCVAWWARRYYSSTVIQLRKAIRTNKLDVHYRPIVNLSTGHLVGAVSRARWSSKETAIATDKSDLTCVLTRAVIRRVAEDYSTWLWACKDFSITVNLCDQNILDQTFADFMADIMATYNLPASVIVFVVSETALSDQKNAATPLCRLRAAGHRIAIDVAEGVDTRQPLTQDWLFPKELPAQALARRYFQCPANINPHAD